MLISPVTEDENAKKEGRGDHVDTTGPSHDYQTANELFDLMASNSYYGAERGEDETLSTRDLVLIYKNVDLGAKLMSKANELKRKAPNQYVETIVYEDFDSDMDLGEICSSEDIHNLMLINQERINLLTTSGIETTVCNKFNYYIDSSTSDLTVDYDRKLSYQNFYKKDRIRMNTNDLDKPVLPASLLDYIHRKCFEDNYNFDMDNIVRYVKLTIDQLKRISNGDYLTEKVKEKWREGDSGMQNEPGEMIEAKTLAVSVPLYVERKVTGDTPKWDDIIHSSIDIKSISKILEKKIIVEVPKTLSGSYTLFSKCCNDNLIIRCQKTLPGLVAKETTQESRVDMVLQLNRSESGHIISNINTIMILNSEKPTEFLPLIKSDSSENCNTPEDKVTEVLNDNRNTVYLDKLKDALGKNKYLAESGLNRPGCSEKEFSDYNFSVPADSGYQTSGTVSNYEEHFKIVNSDTESHINYLSADELRLIKKKLNMSSLPEESIEESSSKKRSPTRNRIKSPYENKLHVIEEKKRKKLLEIKQRRERNKLALSVNGSKVKKIKYPIPPQTANSVTKLSITNKSFYNSIYGQNANIENKPSKTKIRKETRDSIPEVPSNTNITTPILVSDGPDRHSEKYINKSYYLDNAETEMMYTEMKKNDNENFESISTNDIKMKLNLLSDLISPSIVGLTSSELAPENKWPVSDFNNAEKEEIVEINKPSTPPSLDPTNTPNNSPIGTKVTTSEREFDEKGSMKEKTPDDFIKSIDKIYELIHKLGKQDNDTKLCKSKFTAVGERAHYNDAVAETSTAQYSDSGTSVKHQLTSSNPSSYSFERAPKVEETPRTDSASDSISPKKRAMPVVSKVVISAKSQKFDGEKSIKDLKRVVPNNKQNTTENPLIAISKLLHDFDNVQKNRNKIITEKNPRKPEVTFADTKPDSRVFVKKPSKIDQQVDKQLKVAPRERRYRLPITVQQQTLAENRPGLRAPKKKVTDIDDEIKEARGEAVRGPCKLNARLNSLAQPKRIYVQAQIEEFQARYGKSIVTDRLQKLSGMPSGQSVDHFHPVSPKQRKRRVSPEALSTTSKTQSSRPAVLEKPLKRTFNRRETFPNDQSSKQIVIPHDVFKKKIAATSIESTERCSIRSSDKEPSPRRSSDKESSLRYSSKERVNVAYKSRIPYVPNDLELVSIDSSVEGSSAIRGKIHHMIDTIIPTQSFSTKTVHNDTDLIVIEDTTTEHNLRRPQHQRLLKIKCEQNIGDSIPEHNDQIEEPSLNLEKSLCQISAGTFQKHLNHTKTKLTPKNSMHKVLFLQSGDSNSVLLQSTIPQNIKFMKTNNEADCLPVLSNLDWNFAKFPVQMPIVAYSFPKFKINNPYSRATHSETVQRKDSETNKTTQCYKGVHVDIQDQVSQVDIKEYLTFSSLFNMSSTVIKEEELEELKSVSNYETESLETDHVIESGNIKNLAETNISILDEETEISKNVNIKKLAAVIVKQCAKESGNVNDSPEQCDPNGERDHNASKKPNINTSERCNNMYEPEAGDAKISGKSMHAQEQNSIEQNCDVGASGENNVEELETDIKASPECINKVSSMTSSMDTSSLDVLVGLLNEIQKITSCQNQMARFDVDNKEKHTDIETISKITALDNVEREPRNIMSIASLDKLRHLESHASVLSFYLSNIDDRDMIDDLNLTPLYADKGISAVMMPDNVSKCTNAPSRFFPLTVNHSTNMSNSLIGVFSEPSSHSLFSYNELPLRSNKSLTCITNVIDIPKIYKGDTHDEASLVIVKRPVDDGYRNHRYNQEKTINAKEQNVVVCRKNMSKKYALESDFDPVMKMKRDILVTMYSVLVLTVFAALSFPQMLYRA